MDVTRFMNDRPRPDDHPGPDDAERSHRHVVRQLRTMIDYRQINLQSPKWPVPSGLDVIICRNVLIYFEPPLQHRIVSRFGALLAHDGLLIMGHSENITSASDIFTSIGQTVYRPRAAARLTTAGG